MKKNYKNIDIVVADDHALFRKGLITLLHDLDFSGTFMEACNGEELLDIVKKTNPAPELILLDINMPVMDGVKATEILKKDYPDIKIIILTMDGEEQVILHLIEKGVNGYLLKNCEPEELERAVNMVMNNSYYFNQRISDLIRNAFVHNIRPHLPKEDFSARELEVLHLICKELTTNEIAKQLNVSPRTVESHRQNLIEKAGVKNVAGLIVYAIKNRLVTL